MKEQPEKVRFVLGGSGAVRVNPERRGPCFLVSIDDQIMQFDCGRSAVHSTASLGFPVENIDHVFITHLHFDHICDLPYLIMLGWNNVRQRKLTVHGPSGIGHFLEHSINKAYEVDIGTRIAHGKDVKLLEWNVNDPERERDRTTLRNIVSGIQTSI